MKTCFVLAIIVVLVMFISCEDSTELQDRFALYLLEDEDLETKDVQDIALSGLKLRHDPSITYDDILAYQWDEHKLYLEEKFSSYFGSDTLRVFAKYFGEPFVIIANGERIYLGSFTPGVSSWGSNTPKILDYSVNSIEKSFIISGAPVYNETAYIDIRNDERILLALGDKVIQQ